MRRAPLIITILGCIAALSAGASPVEADTPPVRLSIRPLDGSGPYVSLTLNPGERRSVEVELANRGAAPIEARTYAADAYTLVNGGFGARLDGERISSTTTWLEWPTETLRLVSQAAVNRTLAVSVPNDIGPGEYISSLVLQTAEAMPVASASQVNQIQRQAIAVAITVPGPAHPALGIGAIHHVYTFDGSLLTIEVRNPGNRHQRPSGDFRLVDSTGREIDRRSVSLDSVYAGMSTILEVRLPRLAPGSYVASLRLSTDEAMAYAPRLPFTIGDQPANVSSIPLVLLIALAILGFMMLWLAVRKPRRRAISHA